MKKLTLLLLFIATISVGCRKKKLPAPAPAPVDNSLVAYYPMDGNTEDVTIYKNHGTTTAKLIADRKNSSNKAYDFVSDYFQSYNIPITLNKQYTFSFWIKMNSYDNGMSVMELTKQQRYELNPQIWQYGNSIYLTTCSNIYNQMHILSLEKIKTGVETPKWTHVLWTVSKDTTNLYVNGNLKEMKLMPWPAFENVDLTLGNSGNNAITDWGAIGPHKTPSKVSIDEVRIYNRVLSQTEIRKLAE